jgi:hypothetical protein
MHTGHLFAFAGLFPLTLNLLHLPFLLAVPAQIAVARDEEAPLGARLSGVRGPDRAVLAADAAAGEDEYSLNNTGP